MQYASPLTPDALLLRDQIENRRRAKSRARIAKLLAKKSGKTRRMPPEGKAALAAIEAGQR
jgi:hypothetical protein